MRYHINFNKTINQLVPHYLSGRKLILYLKALMQPLQVVSDSFMGWAHETRIQASMSSQVIHFEWFLNRMFKKYYINSEHVITIVDSIKDGTPIYHEDADIPSEDHVVLRLQSESVSETDLYYKNERSETMRCSFTVNSPAIDTKLITTEEYLSMLTHTINKYKLAGKTYMINFN